MRGEVNLWESMRDTRSFAPSSRYASCLDLALIKYPRCIIENMNGPIYLYLGGQIKRRHGSGRKHGQNTQPEQPPEAPFGAPRCNDNQTPHTAHVDPLDFDIFVENPALAGQAWQRGDCQPVIKNTKNWCINSSPPSVASCQIQS